MLRILCSLFVLASVCHAGGKGGKDHDILKIHVPEIVKHQYHTHYVFIHKHAPVKKEPKKKEVVVKHHKHIHIPAPHVHKHWYKSKTHKHVTHGHGVPPPVIIKHHVPKVKVHVVAQKPKTVIHKTVIHHHKKPMEIPMPPPPAPPKMKHHEPGYGYQVTEDYEEEEEDPSIYSPFDADDYSIPGDRNNPHVESQPEDEMRNYNYFSYPSTAANPGTYLYNNQEMTSYDPPAYHQPDKEADDEINYEFDYSRPPESDFEFRKDVFKNAHVEEYGEDTPMYMQHRRRFIKEINDVHKQSYGDENIQYSKHPDHQNELSGI